MDYRHIKEKIENEKKATTNKAKDEYVENEDMLVKQVCRAVTEEITEKVEAFYKASPSQVRESIKRYKNFNGIYPPSFFSKNYKYISSYSNIVISSYDEKVGYEYDGWNYNHIFYIPTTCLNTFINKINQCLNDKEIKVTLSSNRLAISANLGEL